MDNLPCNLKIKIKQIQRKPTVIAGIILVYASKIYIASARYLIYTDKKRMKITDVQVHDGWQRRGVGTLMSGMMKAIARGYGIKYINLLAAIFTHASVFWEKMGFQFCAPHTNRMEYFPQDLNKSFEIG